MKITEIRISNFRSITDEQIINPIELTTLIGANNSGKTNALRAICAFFGGYGNDFGYDRDKDLPADAKDKRTSIILSFEIPENQSWFWNSYDRLHSFHGTSRENNKVTLYLYYSSTNTPVYSFFANQKRPKDKQQEYSKTLRNLTSDFIEKFTVLYIPSEKSITDLYKQLLAPRISSKASKIFSKVLKDLRMELSIIQKSINHNLKTAGIDGSEIHLEIPGDDMKNIIGEFSLQVTDSVKTAYTEKGRGLQAAIFYSSFNWIDECIKDEKKIPIWLIEEPESYMHPELSKNCQSILTNLSKKSLVLISTHSMQFLPKSTTGINFFEKNKSTTKIVKFIKYEEACNSLKKSLGLRFSDYYALNESNVLFEGKWDAYTVRECLPYIKSLTGKPFNLLSSATLIDKTGTSSITGFLKATYEFIRKEVALVTILDGDEAGVKARKELQGFFSKKGEFEANIDYVSVKSGFPLEGIFPKNWIIECHGKNSEWFSPWSVDASGDIEPFDIKDEKKENYAKFMLEKMKACKDAQLINGIILVFEAIENALLKQHAKLKRTEN